MLNFLRPPVVKSVSRTILGLGLSRAACRMHRPTVKYQDPPTSESALRPLASWIGRRDACTHKAGQEASQRIRFVDTHDLGSLDWKDYDVWIPDIDASKLKNEIADLAGIPYHSPATGEEVDTVVNIGDCFLYSPNLRTIFPAVVTSPEGKAHWVFFLVNSGSSLTYLSTQTSELFGITPLHEGVSAAVTIAGHHHTVYRAPQHSHFAEVDILGTRFFNAHGVSQVNDFSTLRAKLFFGNRVWKAMVEGEKL
ncbi:hypothetical protein HOY80DRAFT_959454 [Tuber brumale]|nr:hypothetical protein HOY80DRAFT_959454 [Tuber brumale]